MRKRRVLVLASFFTLALLGSACGGGNEPASAPSSAAQPTETATGGGETRVGLEDFKFDPSNITVATGTTLELDNEGKAPHTFTVQGQSVDVEVAPGENGTADISLPAGDYKVICKFHEGQGMVATMTVTG